jgi:hypothetical protein
MERVGKLQKQSNESLILAGQLQSPSEWNEKVTAIVEEAAKFKRLPMRPEDFVLWRVGLKGHSVEEINQAFIDYLPTKEFFEPGSIVALIEQKRLDAPFKGTYQPVDKAALEAEQATPEWEAALTETREALAKAAKATDDFPHLSEERKQALRAKLERLQRKPAVEVYG